MRFLHTSDWHLGRSFHGANMLAAQESFTEQLLQTVREEAVDVVLIAGDVYDRALPNVDVVRVLDQALVKIRDAGAQVVLSSGNHDSAVRLGFAASVLAAGGVHIRTRLAELTEPVVFGSEADSSDRILVYGIPFLEPRLVAGDLQVDEPGHTAVTQAALELIREDLRERSAAGPVRSIVMAHSFVASGITAESERTLGIGSLGSVPLEIFDGFDYVALGHLHGRQKLSENVRYSGSPLAYSFGEARQEKGGWLFDLDSEGLTNIRKVAWEPQRALAILRGPIQTLLADPGLSEAESAYCQITVTDTQRPAQAMEKLRSRFPHTLVLSHEPDERPARQQLSYRSRVAQATDDVELVSGFLEHVRDRAASAEERADIAQALDLARLQEHSA